MYEPIDDEDLAVSVSGDRCTTSVAQFKRSCSVLILEEQGKPLPNNALIAVLCDGIRLAREYTDRIVQMLELAPHRARERGKSALRTGTGRSLAPRPCSHTP